MTRNKPAAQPAVACIRLLAVMEMFTHDKVNPANPKAEALANAIITLMEAEKALQEAKSKVPNYTAQWDSKDYYAEEQEADALYSANGELTP